VRRALALVFLASTVAATATAQTEVPPPSDPPAAPSRPRPGAVIYEGKRPSVAAEETPRTFPPVNKLVDGKPAPVTGTLSAPSPNPDQPSAETIRPILEAAARTPPPAPAPDSKPTPYLAYAGVALSAVALFIALRRRR